MALDYLVNKFFNCINIIVKQSSYDIYNLLLYHNSSYPEINGQNHNYLGVCSQKKIEKIHKDKSIIK